MSDNHQCFEKNIAALKQYHPGIYQHIESQITEDRCGYIKSDSKLSAMPHVAHMALLIIIGLQDYASVTAYINDNAFQDKYALIIEPNCRLFLQVLDTVDMSSMFVNKKITWLIGFDRADLNAALFHYFIQHHIIPLIELSHIWVYQAMDSALADIFSHVQTSISEQFSYAASMMMKRPAQMMSMIQNMIANWQVCADMPAVHALQGCFSDAVGVVVSTGPSLRDTLPALKRIGHRAIIACVDSGLSYLLENDIVPHMVIAADSAPRIAELFRDMPYLKHTPLIVLPFVHPSTIASYRGPTACYISKEMDQSLFFSDHADVLSGECVSHLAFSVLQYMGCREVYLFGQDLALKRGNNDAYAFKRDDSHYDGHLEDVRCRQVMGNDGTPITSRDDFSRMGVVFSHMVRLENSHARNVIPKHMGAKIDDIDQLDPDQLNPELWSAISLAHVYDAIKATSNNAFEPSVIMETLHLVDSFLHWCHARVSELRHIMVCDKNDVDKNDLCVQIQHLCHHELFRQSEHIFNRLLIGFCSQKILSLRQSLLSYHYDHSDSATHWEGISNNYMDMLVTAMSWAQYMRQHIRRVDGIAVLGSTGCIIQ